MVLAPRVPPPVAAALIEKDIDYVDLAGNCHLAPTPDQLVHVEKRAPERIRGTRNIRPQGYQVVFALLARPELIAEPVREIAMQAGVGKTVVGQTLERLEEEGFIGGNGRKRKLINRARLLTKWLTGYADVLRPRWILGRFRTAKEGKEELPDRVEDYFKGQTEDRPWGFGGTVAADNLTQHYRGFEIVVHTEELPADFARTLRALAAPTGDLIVMRTPGPLAYKGPLPHVVHPLLVYTELMAGDDERAWETARMVLDQYLPELK
ncbi:MAG TPA: type IV toxin-antitoxin system AbiEi family antitoxin [Candidatus Eisenbacteria bacterium]